jgi:hypothetical protein
MLEESPLTAACAQARSEAIFFSLSLEEGVDPVSRTAFAARRTKTQPIGWKTFFTKYLQSNQD